MGAQRQGGSQNADISSASLRKLIQNVRPREDLVALPREGTGVPNKTLSMGSRSAGTKLSSDKIMLWGGNLRLRLSMTMLRNRNW